MERDSLRNEYRLIVDFLGYQHVLRHVLRTNSDLNFKYDWNKLMEVVSFIEEIKNVKYGGFKVIIERDCCLIQSLNRSKSSAYSKSYWSNGNKINAVYNSCLMFIEWYNENVK